MGAHIAGGTWAPVEHRELELPPLGQVCLWPVTLQGLRSFPVLPGDNDRNKPGTFFMQSRGGSSPQMHVCCVNNNNTLHLAFSEHLTFP